MRKIYCRKGNIFQDNITLHVVQESYYMGKVTRGIAKPLVFETISEDGAEIAPSLSIDLTSAQFLMDQLWECGLRPSEGSGSAGSLLATQKHLDDMRKLVFHHNKITQ